MSRLALGSDRRRQKRRPDCERRGPKRISGYNPQSWRCKDGRLVVLRPARASDVALAREFFDELSPRSRYRRFFSTRALRRNELQYLTRFEHSHHMSFVAAVAENGGEKQIAAAHCIMEAGKASAEVALVVADLWQGMGLGEKLLTTLVHNAGIAGIAAVTGIILASNEPMLRLVRKIGAQLRSDPEDPTLCRFSVTLQ